MNSRFMRLRGFAVSASLLCLGCADERWNWMEAEPEFVWRGDWVNIIGYDREADEACGQSLQATEDRAAAIVAFHETDAPVHMEYYWMSQSAWDEIRPCREASACTDHGRPVARELVCAHEIAHAVSRDLGGSCPGVLEEGLAEYFAAAKPSVRGEFEFTKNIEQLLDLPASGILGLPYEDYLQAGHFVSFLVEDYGIHAVRELCHAIPFDGDLDDWDSATRSVLSMPLADVLADYATYPICERHAYRARPGECEGEPDVLVSPSEETSFSLRMGCDEPDAIGERDGTVMITRRVHAPVPGWYDVGIEGGDDVTLVLEQCAPCSEEPYVRRVEGPLPPDDGSFCVWVYSPSECDARELDGTHLFMFFLPADREREVTVRIQPHFSLELD